MQGRKRSKETLSPEPEEFRRIASTIFIIAQVAYFADNMPEFTPY